MCTNNDEKPYQISVVPASYGQLNKITRVKEVTLSNKDLFVVLFDELNSREDRKYVYNKDYICSCSQFDNSWIKIMQPVLDVLVQYIKSNLPYERPRQCFKCIHSCNFSYGKLNNCTRVKEVVADDKDLNSVLTE